MFLGLSQLKRFQVEVPFARQQYCGAELSIAKDVRFDQWLGLE